MTCASMIKKLKAEGVSEHNIAKGLGLLDDEGNPSITMLRDTITISREEIVREQTSRVTALKEKGHSVQVIADMTGIAQSTVRTRLEGSEKIQKQTLKTISDSIRADVDKHTIVDIGFGNHIAMDVSPERYRAAVSILRDEGYETHNIQQRIPGSKNLTIQKVMVPKGTGKGNAIRMRDKIYTPVAWSEDGGKTKFGIHTPLNISSKRLAVKFAEDGGTEKDGMIHIRPGVADLSMGKNKYAQVRIAIDGTHFVKGVALITDDVPAGKDILFHSSKPKSVGVIGSLKSLVRTKEGEIDPDNPFGSYISRQIVVRDKDGKEKLTSALNILREEGDWDTWSNSLPSQMLSKQPQSLIKSQLNETTKHYKAEVDKINSITSPVLRRKQLEKLADKIDSDAVDLRAVAMSPRQRNQVILPLPKMGKHEVYAPNFVTGERVVLIRYPHGGRFEIPELIVNNNNRTAKKLLGNTTDAIGIHPAVAKRLSGADFDGDTVAVIPNPTGKIRGASTLGRAGYDFEKGLNNFDPKNEYGPPHDAKYDKDNFPIVSYKLMKNTGQEMGMISNLITDMSIQGAKPEHIIKAARHSMVVIDAERHHLDYRKSAIDNNISQLNRIYRGPNKRGANSLLSLATSDVRIPERKSRLAQQGGPINPLTGAKEFVNTNKMVSKFDKKTNTYSTETVPKMQIVKRLALTDDAHTLVSTRKDPVELIYADHANAMKGLANSTRLHASKIPTPLMNTAAKKVYRVEVDDLVSQLRRAQAQKPVERQANRIANGILKLKHQEDPTLRYDNDRLKKIERQVRDGAWHRLGLEKPKIEITDRAWDAIVAGAVSSDTFKKILDGNYVSDKRLFELALPRKNTVMTGPVLSRAKAMLQAGMTNADIARVLGVSPSTIRAAVSKGDEE